MNAADHDASWTLVSRSQTFKQLHVSGMSMASFGTWGPDNINSIHQSPDTSMAHVSSSWSRTSELQLQSCRFLNHYSLLKRKKSPIKSQGLIYTVLSLIPQSPKFPCSLLFFSFFPRFNSHPFSFSQLNNT